MTLKSVDLSELELKEDAIGEVIKAINQSGESGRESFSASDAPLGEDIYERYSESADFKEVIDSLDVRDDIKDELKSRFNTIEELRDADLIEIKGIGESRAEEIMEPISSE